MKKQIALALFGVLGFLTLTKTGREFAAKLGARIMQASQRGIDLIAKSEGFSATPYQDAGGWSIGYGHFLLPGERIARVTQTEAKALLTSDIKKANDAIGRLVKVPLSQNQHDALVSLVYNIGVGNFSASTLLKKLNEKDYAAAADQFAVWRKSKNTVIPALVARRANERELFLA